MANPICYSVPLHFSSGCRGAGQQEEQSHQRKKMKVAAAAAGGSGAAAFPNLALSACRICFLNPRPVFLNRPAWFAEFVPEWRATRFRNALLSRCILRFPKPKTCPTVPSAVCAETLLPSQSSLRARLSCPLLVDFGGINTSLSSCLM